MREYYPLNTTVSVKIESVLKHREKWMVPERMSTRMVRCASTLGREEYIGWQMVVPAKGLAEMSIFGSKDISKEDLAWIGEKTGMIRPSVKPAGISEKLCELYELFLPVMESDTCMKIGFNVDVADNNKKGSFSMWPSYYSSEFNEIVKALRTSGAVFRVVTGSACREEEQLCRKHTKNTYDVHNMYPDDYIAIPVRARFLLLLPGSPSLRLKAVLRESSRGVDLRYIGNLQEQKALDVWNHPLQDAPAYPDCAARVMIYEPDIKEPVIGVRLTEEPAKKLPVSSYNTKKNHVVTVGRATDTSGMKRDIRIGEADLRRHYQIIGQTGTGKSTLLINMILSAIRQGYGLTFFDPHGSTVDRILRCVSPEQARKIRVVRIGDADHPVPLGIWDSDDFKKEERTISDLCELFADIFDPKRDGIVGPRYERWLATFAKASIALLGRRASLESITVISRSHENMKKVYRAIGTKHPELAEIIRQEYGMDNSSDFHSLLAWFLCKFQRLTGCEQLRATLGAGTNALDFCHAIDDDTVTLIDLASPVIGTPAARIVGTLIMMKLWNAVLERKNREKTHLVVVDEASLFQTNPLPRMLAEGRKFGISMVLCHQHAGQLTYEVRDALESNSANLSAFRLSPKDAEKAAIRFDDPKMVADLTRLDAFNAITTLSIDGLQTAPFTLEIPKPRKQKNGEELAAEIEKRSIETLVNPYAGLRALTPAEIQDFLDHPEKLEKAGKDRTSDPEWLRNWSKLKSAV